MSKWIEHIQNISNGGDDDNGDDKKPIIYDHPEFGDMPTVDLSKNKVQEDKKDDNGYKPRVVKPRVAEIKSKSERHVAYSNMGDKDFQKSISRITSKPEFDKMLKATRENVMISFKSMLAEVSRHAFYESAAKNMSQEEAMKNIAIRGALILDAITSMHLFTQEELERASSAIISLVINQIIKDSSPDDFEEEENEDYD